MEMKLIRKWRKDTYSIGKLYIDGACICDTLEDTDRGLKSSMTKDEIAKVKIKGKTAIPTGKYTVGMSFSNRFKKIMPILVNVPGFDGIRIHSGNTAADTEGCILCGRNTAVGKITESRIYTSKVYDLISQALRQSKSVTLEITYE